MKYVTNSVVLAAAVLVAGCGEHFARFEPMATTIEIRPRIIESLATGESVNLQAVGNGFLNEITWESRNPKVATIDATGRVFGAGVGTTWVVVTLKPGIDIRDSIQVTVWPANAAGGREYTLLIKSVTLHGTAADIDLAGVKGSIDVTLDYIIPDGVTVGSWQVLLNGQVVCSSGIVERIAQPLCVIDTRSFPNGTTNLKAAILDPSGITLASMTYPQFILSN